MGSILGDLGQGLVAASPGLAAGVGAGIGAGARAKESRRQFDARLKVQEDANEIRRMIAEYKRALDMLELDVKRGQAEVLNELRMRQGALAETRARDLEETRPARVAGAEALARSRGAGAALLERKAELGLPDLEAALTRARTGAVTGREAREAGREPFVRGNLEARTALAGAQAATIPRDDARMDFAARALAAYRSRTAALGEKREARQAKEGRDRLVIQRIHADAAALNAATNAGVGQARINRMNEDLRRLKGRFPDQWLQQLDRDIKVGWQKGYRGQLSQEPDSVAARERATRMLEMMWRSLGFPADTPPGLSGANVLPANANDPSFWDRLLQGTVGFADRLGQGALGFMDRLGQGALDVGQQFHDWMETTPPSMGVPPPPNGPAPPILPPGAGAGAPPTTLPAVPEPGAPPPSQPSRPTGPAPVSYEPAERLEESIAWLRSIGDTKKLKIYLDAWRDRTGQPYPLKTYPNRPRGLSDGDIDYARILLKRGWFESIGKQFVAVQDWETVNDLIAAWGYLNRPDPARVKALKRRWGVPEVLSPRGRR